MFLLASARRRPVDNVHYVQHRSITADDSQFFGNRHTLLLDDDAHVRLLLLLRQSDDERERLYSINVNNLCNFVFDFRV